MHPWVPADLWSVVCTARIVIPASVETEQPTTEDLYGAKK